MSKTELNGNEITVRISVAFQEAPDLHTLLSMTPTRERGKLIRQALERYILSTNHPAGNVDVQIEAISTRLRNRTSNISATTAPIFKPRKVISDLGCCPKEEEFQGSPKGGEIEQRQHAQCVDEDGRSGTQITSGEVNSMLVRRWLCD